jgi:co-chaperonin GroES (HSP10)
MPEFNLRPMRKKALIEPVTKYGKTQSGLYTASAANEIPSKGTVLRINGASNINPGDTVYLKKYFWKDFSYNGQKLLSVKLEDILAGERNGHVYATNDSIVMRIDYAESIGKIIIPGNRRGYRADAKGEVVAVGPDYKYSLKPGDKVYILRMEDAFHEGFEIETAQGKLWSVREKWVYAKEVV